MDSEQSQNPQPVFDQQPIGKQNKNPMMDQYPPDFNPNDIMEDVKPEPIPLAKRVTSKVWKVRKEAFQQLHKEVCDSWENYNEFENMTIPFITDSNQMCQDKALKIFLIFLEAGNQLHIDPKPVIKVLLEKCVTVKKGEISQTSTQVLMWMMDHYQQILLNEVNETLDNKNFKILECTLTFIQQLLNNYGAKKLNFLQKFAKHFTLLANSVRPVAKMQSIELFKEAFRWMGDNALQFNLHPQVKDEVVKFSKTYEKVPMVIKRGLNEEQKKSKKPITECNDDDDQDNEPQDVLGPYDSRWVDKLLEMEKWKTKKQVLDEFIKKTKAKQIVVRQNSQYITLIKRLLVDNNINLLQCGFKVVKNLCKGLKKHFAHPTKAFSTLVFTKLKDSKAMIVDEAHESLQAMLNCINFEDLMEDIRDGIKDKAANMRLQTLKFLELCIQRKEKKMTNGFKVLTQTIANMNQDGSSEVRDKALDLLCKMKVSYGMNFFGDKLKKMNSKKIQTIQNYVDPNQNYTQDEPIMEEKSQYCKKQAEGKSCKEYPIPNKTGKASVNMSTLSEPVPKNIPSSQFQNSNESIRLNFYQNLLQKPPQMITHDLIEGYKNKVPMVRQSSPNILRLLLNLVKKCTNMLQPQHIQFLTYHDWKKCKHLLVEFIQTSKLSLSGLELVKNLGLVSQGGATLRRTERHAEQYSGNYPQQHSSYGQQNHNSSVNPLKHFYSSLSNLIPRMSNPDFGIRMQAAQKTLQLLAQIPSNAPLQSTTEPTPSLSQIISQFFNVLRCRIQDTNVEISNKFIEVITSLCAKGFLTKYRTPGRQLLSLCIQKLPHHKQFSSLDQLLEQMTKSQSILIWQLLATELPKEQFCSRILDLIRKYFESFFKAAEQKSFILPLLTCISKDYEIQRCSQLLDQIVEINGEQSLSKIVRQSKFLPSNSLENCLKKWDIQVQKLEKAVKGKNQTISNSFISPTFTNKFDRINADLQNSWPLSPLPSLILKLISTFMGMGEPFITLASPLCLTANQFSVISQFQADFLEDYSDLLCKWVMWRVNIEFIPENVERILQLANRIINCGFQLHESEIVTLLGAILNCFSIHKNTYMKSIWRLNSSLNSNPFYKQRAFRFWINSFNEPNSPVDQILQLLVHCFEDMIQTELVTLARFPAVVRNKEFNSYLRANYTEKLLTVYGFKLQDFGRNESQKNLKSSTLVNEKLNKEEKKMYIEFFQRSSSNEVIEKIIQHTEGINHDALMGKHLQIMHSIIIPYMERELSFINVYNYFKYIQKIIINLNYSSFLLNLVQTLAFFLVDLDEIKLQNNAEMLKTINKLLLIILQNSEPKHILEVIFVIFRHQLKANDSSKLNLLLPKCASKVIKTPSFRQEVQRNPLILDCLYFMIRESFDIVVHFDFSFDTPVMKTIKNLLNEIYTNYPQSQNIYEQFSKATPVNPKIEYLLKEIVEQRSKQNRPFEKINEAKVYSHTNDPKANASRMQVMASQGTDIVNGKPLE